MIKKFPLIVYLAYDPKSGGGDDYLYVVTDGIDDLEPGQRCAIYKRVDEGTVHGPKSFIPKRS